MSRLANASTASFCVAIALTTLGVTLLNPSQPLGLCVAAVCFCGVFLSGIVVWAFVSEDSAKQTSLAALATVLASYPVSVFLLALAAHLAAGLGFDVVAERVPQTHSPFMAVLLTPLMFWYWPTLIVSTMLTFPLGVAVASLVGACRQLAVKWYQQKAVESNFQDPSPTPVERLRCRADVVLAAVLTSVGLMAISCRAVLF